MYPTLAILAAAPILIWPALLNGYPLLFVDAGAYLLHTITGDAPWDKTAAYGPLIAIFHQGVTLWGPALAQGALTSWVIWVTQRVARGAARPGTHLALCLGLAAFTSQPWFTAMIMPDVFAPLVALGIYGLGFGEARLRRAEMLGLGLVAALGIAAHLSHLPIALSLLVVVAVLRLRPRPVLRAAAPVALAVVTLLAANQHYFGRMTLSAHGSAFMLARLQDDGPAVRVLRDRCPGAGWHLCLFIDEMPLDSDRFLWGPRSPMNLTRERVERDDGGVQIAAEAREIVSATLRDYPVEVARAMAGNTWRQFFMVLIDDMFTPGDMGDLARHVIPSGFPEREARAMRGALQFTGRLEAIAVPLRAPHGPVLLLAVALAGFGLWRAVRARWREGAALVLCMLAALAANAFVGGALSKPHYRYQARIIWILPLTAVLLVRPPPVPRCETA